MGMEPVVQPEAEIDRNLRLLRQMQAATIELCVAWMEKEFSHIPQSARINGQAMKQYVSRVCGLTEKDFEREDDGTQKTKTEEIDWRDKWGADSYPADY
jgi:hypothetical protein